MQKRYTFTDIVSADDYSVGFEYFPFAVLVEGMEYVIPESIGRKYALVSGTPRICSRRTQRTTNQPPGILFMLEVLAPPGASFVWLGLCKKCGDSFKLYHYVPGHEQMCRFCSETDDSEDSNA